MLLYKRAGKEYGIFRYAVLFSEIENRLDELSKKYKKNLRYDVMGYSNEGRELFLVTVASDVSKQYLSDYSEQRKKLFENPKEALKNFDEKNCPPLPILINCNLHGNEISGTDGMFTFIEEILSSEEKDRYLKDAVLLISICLNPDGRSRGLDSTNGHCVDLNRDFMTQTQPETQALISGCIKKYYPTVFLDMHGYMASGNILIDPCTPPHNPFSEYDLLEKHLLENARSMALEIKKRTNLDTDIPAEIWDDGWEDYCPVFTTGYLMLNGAVAHTIEVNFPSEEGAYVAHCAAVGMMNFLHDYKQSLYKNQCVFYQRGIENKKDNEFHTDYYLIKADKNPATEKTIEQLIFNNIAVFKNEKGDYVVPLEQPLRPLIHNMLWNGEDISDMIKECYDVAFYSHTVMRGLDVSKHTKDSDEVQNLKPIDSSAKYFPKIKETKTKTKADGLRVLAITESGTIDEILSKAGYDVHFLPFSELNTGWKIDTSAYDVLIAGGTKSQFWEDPFEDFAGVSYQVSGGLWNRGRLELLRAAKEFDKLILFGYAGMAINEQLGKIKAHTLTPEEDRGSSYDPETNKYTFNASNGSFKMLPMKEDVLCNGYDDEKIFYLVAPVAFNEVDATVSLRFAKNSFINGFNKNKSEMDGLIAAFHKTDGTCKTVVFGFDPVYRGYTDVSFQMLLNAVEFLK